MMFCAKLKSQDLNISRWWVFLDFIDLKENYDSEITGRNTNKIVNIFLPFNHIILLFIWILLYYSIKKELRTAKCINVLLHFRKNKHKCCFESSFKS